MNETTKDVVEETVENEENKATEKIPLVGDFCVAGFLMPHFWGICNGIKIAWLAFIPIVYPFLAFYFGAEGYRLAYENKKWNVSIEEFCAKQKKWLKGSIIYAIVVVAIIVICNLC